MGDRACLSRCDRRPLGWSWVASVLIAFACVAYCQEAYSAPPEAGESSRAAVAVESDQAAAEGSGGNIDSAGTSEIEQRTRAELGIGFLFTEQSKAVTGHLGAAGDFVDVIIGPGKLEVFDHVKQPVRVGCISMSLERQAGRPFPGVRESIEILRQAKVDPGRVIIAYNPERRPKLPSAELDALVESVKRAKVLAADYGAPLLVGPGLREMQGKEHLYAELARHCDIWLIQSQRLQLDAGTRRPVSVEQYRARVRQIVEKLREGNPQIRVVVQLVTTAERGEVVLTAEQLAGFARSVEDLVDGVRLYGASAELLEQTIALLRPPAVAQKTADGAATKRSVAVPMRDGKHLATDIYLPTGFGAEGGGRKWPTVLVVTPYGKGRSGPLGRWRDAFVGHGYVFAVQDMRGFYDSKEAGQGQPRHNDGYDTIEYLASQPWSNGKVGMLGYSHLGAAQYEAGSTTPPHLSCAIPAQAPGNYYTNSYFPPVLRKADMETLMRGRLSARTDQLLRRRKRTPAVSDIGKFNSPMIHSAGWYDFYVEGAIEMFRAVQRDGGEGARGRQKLIIGPWGHGVLQEESPGEPLLLPGGLAYPPHSRLDWPEDVWWPWYDHWLKGQETGVMEQSAVRYYLMGDIDDLDGPGNVWIEADDFPPPSRTVVYYAHADGKLSTSAQEVEEASLTYRYDPADPVPTVGRTHARLPVKGPYDQRPVEGRKDVLIFSTAALEEPLRIVGRVRVKLWASSDCVDTDFTAKLTDVYGDGRSMLIMDSIVKGRYRLGYLNEELLTPGKAYEFEIDLGHTAIVLARGHRLRLAISSSNFDRFDINPNTGEPYGDHALSRRLLIERLKAEGLRGEPKYTEAKVATNTVFVDAKRPTQVLLPVMPVE